MAKINFALNRSPADKTPLDVARAFIAAGVAVFPCREMASEGIDYATGEIIEFAEKAPLTTFGLKDATRSSRIIDIWFGERHPSALIGVPTGEKLGGWILDLDRHANDDGSMRDGHTWLAEMESLHGPLPDTPRAKTANGGTHIFFKHVDGVRNRAAIADGVDCRAEGGYIIGPGSVMADGRSYEWINHDGDGMPEFADAPAWLIDLVITKKYDASSATHSPSAQATGRNPVYVDRAVNAELDKLASTPQGGRSDALNAAAFTLGRLVGGGHLSESDAQSSLEAIAKQWPNFHKSRGTISRGLKDGMAQPREVPLPEYANDNTPTAAPEAIAAFVERSKAKAATSKVAEDVVSDQAAVATDDAPAPPKKRERFELTWFDEIEEGKPKETILKGWLGVGEFTTISGLPGTGKSVIVTDIACHIAAGIEWHGKKIKQGLVIYVAAERKKLTERRMMAFRQHHGVENVPLLVIGGRLDFTKDLKDARDLIAAIREAETITGQKCVWVIVDTLTRVFGGGDQNASKDMTRFVQSCDEILAETKAHVTAIHHSAWSGERGKGAIDLDGAVDASFMVKKDGNKHRLVCDGTNDGEEGDVLAFTMKSVQIGVDEDGEPTTAPVVVPADSMDSGERLVENIKGHNARAFEILKHLIDTTGGTVESPHFPPDALVVKEDAWRQAVYDDDKDARQTTLTQRFSRAHKFLKDSNKVEQVGQWVFLS